MSIFRKIKEWYQKKKQKRLETALQMCGIDPRRRANAKPLDAEYPFGGVYESMDEFEAYLEELKEKYRFDGTPIFCPPAVGTIAVIRDGEGYTVWVWNGERLEELSVDVNEEVAARWGTSEAET